MYNIYSHVVPIFFAAIKKMYVIVYTHEFINCNHKI